MALRFCANLNFLFCETGASVLDKFRLARQAGFVGVETGIPETISVEQAVAAQKENGVQVVLLNICLGSIKGTEFGCASLPNFEEDFQRNFQKTLSFARALNCKKIHIMAGKPSTSETSQENDDTYVRNLKYAASQLESTDIIGLIEPINKYSLPGYYLDNYEKAINVLETVNSKNIKLMVDLFHLQLIKGNITNTLQDVKSFIGHVQVAQAPTRNEPNTPGEVNFKYVFETLERIDYKGWVGCEYKPLGQSKDGLNWIKEYGYSF